MSFFLREQVELDRDSQGLIKWEESSCPLCDGENWNPLVEAPDLSQATMGPWFLVVQCQECGLCFTNPRPTERSLAHFYRSDYPPHQKKLFSEENDKSPWFTWNIGRWLGRMDYRKGLPWHGQGRLLDFGCGGGSFLWRMHRQGWQVMGLDLSSASIQRVRRELGLPAIVGSLPHEDLEKASFDVITMWQSLEHVAQPLEVLRAAHHLLAPGGKLVVAVPNIDSLPFRWFGQAWFGLDLPRHLTHFAPWTLRLMVQRAGFRPGPIHTMRRSSWLRSSARQACRLHASVPRLVRWMQGKITSNLGSWYSYLTRQADCMMITAEKE